MKKIKSVKRNLIEYELISEGVWKSKISSHYGYFEIIPEIVILNCPLFEVEYEPERWRAEFGKTFYYIAYDRRINESCDERRNFTNECYEAGNYFKTKQQAQRYIDESLNILQKIHEEEGNYERN